MSEKEFYEKLDRLYRIVFTEDAQKDLSTYGP